MRKRKAGCVPVRRRPSGSWEVLLVQSRWTPSVWLFPKGGVEDGETGKEAAVRETLEEGGVAGSLGPKLGVWTQDSASKQKQKMWILYVHTEYGPDAKMWKERKKRLRAWHSFEEARAIMAGIPEEDRRPELLEMLAAAKKTLSELGPSDTDDANKANADDGDSDDESTEQSKQL